MLTFGNTRRAAPNGLQSLADAEQHWTPEQVEVYQLTQLRHTIRLAQTHVPHYQQRFAEAGVSYLDLHTAQDLVRFPFLTNDDLTERSELLRKPTVDNGDQNGMLVPPRRPEELEPNTTGATESETASKEKVYLRQLFGRTGVKPGSRTAYIGDDRQFGKDASRRWTFDIRRRSLALSASELTQQHLPDYLDRLNKFAPSLIVAYPSAMIALALEIQARKARPPIGLRAIVCTSERLDLPQQRFIEATFGVRVFARYIQPHPVAMASQTADSDLYYFSPSYGFAELDAPDDNGISEVIVTSFHNDIAPIVRYRTGDLVVPAQSDPADKTFPWLAIAGFVGRRDEYLLTRSKKRVRPIRLSLSERPFQKIVSVQFYQEEPGLVTLRYLSTSALSKREQTQVLRRLRATLGPEITVELKPTFELPKLPSGQLPWLVQNCDEALAEP